MFTEEDGTTINNEERKEFYLKNALKSSRKNQGF